MFHGSRVANKPADDEHPFGYGNRRYFWAFIVALVLFSLGGLFAIYEGIDKLRHPHELENIGLAIGILLFAVVLESWSFRTALVETEPRARRRHEPVASHPRDEVARAARSCCSRTPAH